MKHIKTVINGNKELNNSSINEKEIRYASGCKTSVTVGWQPQERNVNNRGEK